MVITNEQYVLAIGRAGLTYADGVLAAARKDVSGCSPDWGKYACWLKEIKAAQYFLSLGDYTSTDAIYFYNEMLRIAEMNHISPTIDPTAQPVGGIVITPTGSGIYVDLISNQNNINGFKGFLKPVTIPDGTAPTHAVNLSQLNAKAPTGLRNQIQYVSTDDTNDYYTDNNMVSGQFISTDDELTAALTRGGEAQQAIFDTWKRFSHGNTAGLTNNIPSFPLETNSWAYDEGTNAINSTFNTNSGIGFFSNDKYEDYVQFVTLTSTAADNDWIGAVIAFYEDPDDLVTNQAFGLDPNDFAWPIDVTSATIPNQHTLSVIRNRNNINNQYFIAYDFGKLTQKIVANGTTLVGLYKTLNNWSGVSVDLQIIREGSNITTYSSQYSDNATGKGSPDFQLTVDLASDPDLEKFIGKQPYGYFAMSQLDASFIDVNFSENNNVIYDLRNGDTYVFEAAGYELDSSRSFFTEVGVERFLYNPYEFIIFYVQRDGTIIATSTASLTASNGLTETGGNIKLGGNLTENTTIGVTSKGLSITGQDDDYLLTGSFRLDDGHGGVNPAIRFVLVGPLGTGLLTILDGATTIGGAGEGINFNTTGTIFTSFALKWAKYDLDYSALGSLDDRSIPDLGYIKTLIPSLTGYVTLDGDNVFTGDNTFEGRLTGEGGFDLSGGQSSIDLTGALSIDATGLQFGSTPLYEAGSPVITDPTFVYVTKFNGTSYTISRVPVSFLIAKENTIDAIGDSMTANGFYVNALQALLPAAHTIINMGISGNRAVNMDARFSAVTNSGSKDVIIFGGVNDISAGATAAEIEASLQSMYTKARTAGKTQIIAYTIPPFGTSAIYTAPNEAVRVAVNTWITTTATNVDKVIDVSTLLQDPLNNLNLNPLYDSGDGLHFNSAGGVVIANNVIANVTFTTNLTNTNLKISNNVSLQQGLGVFDVPTFRSVNLNTVSLCGTQTTGTPTATIMAGAINNIALLLKAALATQISDMMQVQYASGTPYFQIGPAIAVNAFIQTITTPDTIKGLLIKFASPTYATNPIEIQDSTGTIVARINQVGQIGASGIFNQTSVSNANITLGTTGITESRNIADANPVVTIQNLNSASTGALLRFIWGSNTTVGNFASRGLTLGSNTVNTNTFHILRATNGLGTVSVTATSGTVTGTGTDFQNRFNVGETITANGETHTISAIASDVSMTTDVWTNTFSGIYTTTNKNNFIVNANGKIAITKMSVAGGILYSSTTAGNIEQSAAITGLVKGNGAGAPTQAVANTDYAPVDSPVFTTAVTLNTSSTGTVTMAVSNSNAGAASDARVSVSNGTVLLSMIMRGTGFTSNANNGFFNLTGTGSLGWLLNGTERLRMLTSGNLGLGITTATAYLHIKAGTATAGTAPVKLVAGTNLTAAEAGAIEFDGTDLFYTTSTPTRRTVANIAAPQTLSNKTLTTPILTGYTVATLPAGTIGMMAYVTDALTPTYLGALVGGGAVVTPVFYNGSAWVSY